MVCDRAFIFHMCVPCGKTFSLVPMSRSSVKTRALHAGDMLGCRCWTVNKFQVKKKKQGCNLAKNAPRFIILDGIHWSFDIEHNYASSFK